MCNPQHNTKSQPVGGNVLYMWYVHVVVHLKNTPSNIIVSGSGISDMGLNISTGRFKSTAILQDSSLKNQNYNHVLLDVDPKTFCISNRTSKNGRLIYYIQLPWAFLWQDNIKQKLQLTTILYVKQTNNLENECCVIILCDYTMMQGHIMVRRYGNHINNEAIFGCSFKIVKWIIVYDIRVSSILYK